MNHMVQGYDKCYETRVAIRFNRNYKNRMHIVWFKGDQEDIWKDWRRISSLQELFKPKVAIAKQEEYSEGETEQRDSPIEDEEVTGEDDEAQASCPLPKPAVTPSRMAPGICAKSTSVPSTNTQKIGDGKDGRPRLPQPPRRIDNSEHENLKGIVMTGTLPNQLKAMDELKKAQMTLQQLNDVGLGALTKKLMLFHAIDSVRNAAKMARLEWKERLYPKEWAEALSKADTPQRTEHTTKEESSQAVANRRKIYWRHKFEGMYRKHNPQRVADVDRLVEKYIGLEAEMYEFMCNKYNYQEHDAAEGKQSDAHKESMSESSKRQKTNK